MKYIEKHFDTDVVRRYNKELQEKGLDEDSLTKRKEAGEKLKAGDLYAQIKRRDIILAFEELREQMFEEQGGICCYCGCVLAKQHCSNEHLKPKSRYVELVGEYKNMLLSCRTSQQEQEEIAREINKQKDTHIKLSKERKKHYHCDEHKQDDEISVTPLDEDCEQLFIYKSDGTVCGKNKQAKETIETLNLNCKSLVSQRRTAIQTIIFSDSYPASKEEYVKELRYISEHIMDKTPKDNLHREFCFVIKSVLEDLLQDK